MGKKPLACDNGVFLQDPDLDNPLNFFGGFSLECGSEPFKVFESDEPTEMHMRIIQQEQFENIDLCELTVRVEVKRGPDLVFRIQPPNSPNSNSDENSVSFYSKNVVRVTIQCESGTGAGCRGSWESSIFLRNSKKCPSPLCPVSFVSSIDLGFSLECGTPEHKIFESDEATEMAFSVRLERVFERQEDLCDLLVNVELDNGSTISFMIPNPQQTPFNSGNSFFFYSKIAVKVTLVCQSTGGTGCRGRYTEHLILREEICR